MATRLSDLGGDDLSAKASLFVAQPVLESKDCRLLVGTSSICLGLQGALLTRGLLLLVRSRTCAVLIDCISRAVTDGHLAFCVVFCRRADVRLGRTGLGLAGLALRPRG